MSRRRSAVLDTQPALWDDEPPAPVSPTPKPPPKPARRRLRNHVLELPRPWPKHMPCAMTCLVCDQTEGSGVCPDGCAIICGRPHKTGPIEICVVTLTLPGRRIRRHAVVECPHCDGTHWHQPYPGRRYVVGQCGQPYIIHIAERSTP